MSNGRLLHYVFKIPKRAETVEFYRALGYKALRHEEFTEGCEAQCNGPYSGHWSKTMIGYGAEDEHFVAELTYNYEIRTYEPGNIHLASLIKSDEVFEMASKIDGSTKTESKVTLTSPCGYNFEVTKGNQGQAVCGVRLASSDLARTKAFWCGLAKLTALEDQDKLTLNYPDRQIWMEFEKVEEIKPAGNYGRTAIAWPTDGLRQIEAEAPKLGGKILTPYLTLPTPGKADVVVVIVADPDGHEICFVGDDGFRDLSQVDPESDSLLDAAIAKDQSQAWHEKQAKKGIFH